MSKPGPALTFYLEHQDDVAALAMLEAPPEDISAEDWAKFTRVVALANEDAAEFLTLVRAAIVDALGDVIIAIGNGAGRKTLATEWDAWRTFKPAGKGKKTDFGWVGASLILSGGKGARLVGYLRPRTASEGLFQALAASGPATRDVHNYTESTVLLFDEVVTADTELLDAVNAVAKRFGAAREGLKAYLA